MNYPDGVNYRLLCTRHPDVSSVRRVKTFVLLDVRHYSALHPHDNRTQWDAIFKAVISAFGNRDDVMCLYLHSTKLMTDATTSTAGRQCIINNFLAKTHEIPSASSKFRIYVLYFKLDHSSSPASCATCNPTTLLILSFHFTFLIFLVCYRGAKSRPRYNAGSCMRLLKSCINPALGYKCIDNKSNLPRRKLFFAFIPCIGKLLDINSGFDTIMLNYPMDS